MLCACVKEVQVVPIYELGCPEKTFSLTPEAGSVRFTIYANGVFNGTVNADWMDVTRFRGQKTFTMEGDCSIDVAFGHNEGDTRVGTIDLVMGNRTVTLSIVQKGDQTVEIGVVAECVGTTTSAACFRFGEGETKEEQYAYPYKIGIFADADTTQLVVRHFVDGSSSIWNKTTPAFTFAGLESGRTYYFAAINTATGKTSEIVEATTKEFELVEAGSASPVAGSVLLAEDFSEIPWNGDEVFGGAGFRASDISSFAAPEGELPEGVFGNKSFECPLFDKGSAAFGDAVAESRLRGWSVLGEPGAPDNRVKMVFSRCGYLKMGGYSYCAGLVSPELGVIPKGKVGKVRVDFTASRYGTDSENVVVSLVDGAVKDFVFEPLARTDVQMDLSTKVGWNSYSAEFDDVTASSRILIGPDYERSGAGDGRTQHRMFLTDMTVTLLDIMDDVKPSDVAVSRVLFSEASLDWAAPESAEACKVYLDGEAVAVLENGERHYDLKGLEQGRTYTLAVSAILGGVEKMAPEVEFTTKDVRVVETSPTHVCVEWDDLSKPKLWSGQDRAYEMELCADAACADALVELVSFDGVSTNYFAFNDGRTSSTSTTYWNGILNGVPRLTRARVSIGCLQPATTYWFRVRSRAVISATGKDGKTYTLTNEAGDSEWSEPVAVTTKPVHTPVQGEVIFQGFDKYTLQRDLHNQCPGIQPRISSADRAAFTGLELPFAAGFGLNTFGGMGDAYNVTKWGWFKAPSGSDGSYFEGATFNSQTNLVDADGWHFGGDVFPEMGYFHISSGKGYYIGTPALTQNLSSEPTLCTLSFDGFANFASYSTDSAKPLALKIAHADGTVTDLSCPGIPYAYENASPSKTNFVFDTSFKKVSVDVPLVAGDAVIIVSNGANRCMIDNILIFKK